MRNMACGAFALFAGAVMVAVGCSQATGMPVRVEERPPGVAATAEETKLAAEANRAFAVDLYRQLAKQHPGENIFLSPFSVSSALLIAAEGAGGETAEQMDQVLHAPRGAAAADAGRLAKMHKGQAAIYYRLSPEPVSPELGEKIARLRRDLDSANAKTANLNRSDKWEDAIKSNREAEKLVAQLNPLLKQTEPYVWRAANALWAEKTYPFSAAYLDAIHKYYGNVARPVDFRGRAEAARGEINGWVSEQTRDRIKDLFPPGSIDGMTRLVITNAVYFKGEWLEPFDESGTKPQDFQLADGKKVKTTMMSKYCWNSVGYGAFQADGKPFKTPTEIPINMPDDDPSLYPDANGFTATCMPYKGNKLYMVIFVPRSADHIAALEEGIAKTGIKPWIDGIIDRTVIVNVPKFKLEAEYGLEDSLQALGMTRAFKNPLEPGGAEFDRMTAGDDPAKKLFISAVRHKTFVEVNEKGTEAAAATGVALPAAEARPEPPKTKPFIPTFRADKPFLFAICDSESHSVLFLGRVMKP